MNTANIRAALKAKLAVVTGLNAYLYWPDAKDIVFPAATPVPGPAHEDETFDGETTVDWEVHVLAGWAADLGWTTGQQTLDQYCDNTGGKSIKAALEADQTLNATAEAVNVVGPRNYHFNHRVNPSGPPCWGAIFDVHIMVP